MARKLFPSLIALAVLAVFGGAVPVLAADRDTAINRAREHIVNFPGRSLHGGDHSYEIRDVIIDADGTEHVRFDRRYKGLRVIGGDMVVHSSRTGTLLSISGTLNRLIDMPIRPSFSAAQALQAALSSHPGDARGTAPSPVIYARDDLPLLAWDVRVFGKQDDGTPSEKHVIVDAHNGQVLDAWDDIHQTSGTGIGYGFSNGTVPLNTDYDGTTHWLRDPNSGGQYTTNMKNQTSGTGSVFSDDDNSWGDINQKDPLTNSQTVGVDAQYGSAVTWDYYKTIHQRNGIKAGMVAYSRVHYYVNYNNAFWSDSCFCMTYGDGDGSTFYPFASLDVAGHEMTHGVTSATAELIYSGESGGLNEATSDIFGTMVEYHANNANDPADYRIGEKLYISNKDKSEADKKALRYMYQPSKDGRSADCWYKGVGGLNVHYSSGVANHFFYLLAEGTHLNGQQVSKTCNPKDKRIAQGNGTLNGIGPKKAERIWYFALTTSMTSNTKYSGARAATLDAAAKLYGAGSPEVNSVAAAWSAVLVGN